MVVVEDDTDWKRTCLIAVWHMLNATKWLFCLLILYIYYRFEGLDLVPNNIFACTHCINSIVNDDEIQFKVFYCHHNTSTPNTHSYRNEVQRILIARCIYISYNLYCSLSTDFNMT